MKAPCVLLGLFLICGSIPAQSVRYVTLYNTNQTAAVSCSVQTNEVVQMVGAIPGASVKGFCAQGFVLFTTTPATVFTGLTNLTVSANGGSPEYATFQITTPGSATVSNYVPADAVVIPTSSTGPVQVILETSPDLVNWTAASPGVYSAANGTNRFFRVRAVAN